MEPEIWDAGLVLPFRHRPPSAPPSIRGRPHPSAPRNPEIWDALGEICAREQLDRRTLVRRIEQLAHSREPPTSAVRVYVLTYFRDAATEEDIALQAMGADRAVALRLRQPRPSPQAWSRMLPRAQQDL